MKLPLRLLPVVFIFICIGHANADESSLSLLSSNVYGMVGLNTVPSARMDKAGTIKLSVGTAHPYIHTQLGFQASDRLYLGLRQTGEISSLRAEPDHVFPGLDLKFKLFNEGSIRPEISIGLQSAFGHKRMAGEYLAFTKRYENFDFTGGFGWGRFGTRNTTANPLDWTGSYFGERRNLDGEKPNSPKDWFTGDTGFFAGVEYQLPWQGLSLKADWSSDGYKVEKALGEDGPAPYSFGISYQPVQGIETGVAILGKDTLMARLSLKTNLADWPLSSASNNPSSKSYGFHLESLSKTNEVTSDQIYINNNVSFPHQLSQAWRVIGQSNNSDSIRLEPVFFGLKGQAISVDRNDIAKAATGNGSAEEIWQHIAFDSNAADAKNFEKIIPFLTLRENFSLSEDDNSLLHRTDIFATLDHQLLTNFLSETSLRYNLFSNLDRIETSRTLPTEPVRSDIPYYSDRKLAIDRLFLQGFKSFSTSWHASASMGYLEEVFAGYHGEILYRPWGKNWAAGIEASEVYKRDYLTSLNLGLMDEARTTGHLNFYYEIPDTDMTVHASLGQYLGQDRGGTITLADNFADGAKLEAFFTATNKSDTDIYGASANYSSGLKFSLPLGSLKYIPEGSSIDINAVPVGRDAGQKLDVAHPLYDMTEKLSYRHLTRNWGDVTN